MNAKRPKGGATALNLVVVRGRDQRARRLAPAALAPAAAFLLDALGAPPRSLAWLLADPPRGLRAPLLAGAPPWAGLDDVAAHVSGAHRAATKFQAHHRRRAAARRARAR